MRNTAAVTGGKPISGIRSQSISGISIINYLLAFYDIYGRKRVVLFFYFVLDTTQEEDLEWCFLIIGLYIRDPI
jgi:hypothetical protein